MGSLGYAAGFERMIRYINDQLPQNEVIGQALRREVPMYPPIAVRELAATVIIHQDFQLTGTGPTIEISHGPTGAGSSGLPSRLRTPSSLPLLRMRTTSMPFVVQSESSGGHRMTGRSEPAHSTKKVPCPTRHAHRDFRK